MSDLILEVKDLRGGYRPRVNILNGVSISLHPGEILGVIGLNGSGKSTFGRALVNLLPYRDGSVFFKGEDVTNLTTDKLASSGLKMMMQGGRVFMNLSVWHNLELSAGKKAVKDFVEEYADEIPLLKKPTKELKSLWADKLSGGQRHQLALAMTIATKPDCVILDEPSAGLSPASVNNMYAVLRDIHKSSGITIVLIEQNIAKAIEFSDRSVLINQGRIVKEFTSRDVAEVEAEMFRI